MKWRLAVKSLSTQPVRSVVLACGFGSGIAAMAGLLGIGDVILEQARSPALEGGGDAVVLGVTGTVPSARFLLSSVFTSPPLSGRLDAASPTLSALLYLLELDGDVTRVRARGGIPTLERAIADPETSSVQAWRDTPEDLAWARPDPADVLRAMDRFHPVPAVPERADSWAEWLYFNGRSGDTRFYLTFLVGPLVGPDRRMAGVRLQLERGGRSQSFSDGAEVSDTILLDGAPDMRIGASRVRLNGLRYEIELNLFREPPEGQPVDRRGHPDPEPDVSGRLVLEAVPGLSVPPLQVRGARGWVTGYVVPVLSGALTGELRVEGDPLEIDGSGYHDHNWGFWEGVTWQWGQVAHEDLSFVYGRIRPPLDAADPDRVPGLLVALGPDGPIGYTTEVTIEETEDPELGRPRSIRVRGSGNNLKLEMNLIVEDAIRNRMVGPFGPGGGGIDFWQLGATFDVNGHVDDKEIRFKTRGAAETFRGGE